MLLLRDLRAPLDVDDAALAQLAAQALHVPAREVRSVRLVRRALDARKKQDIHLRLHLLAALDPALEASLLKRGLPHVAPCPAQEPVEPIAGSETPRGRIAVAGLGPAGLFAAWLLARQGYRPSSLMVPPTAHRLLWQLVMAYGSGNSVSPLARAVWMMPT